MGQRSNLRLFAIAVAIAVVGALALGVPAGTLAVLAIVAVCPLMMRSMHRDHSGHDRNRDQTGPSRRSPTTTSRLTARSV